MKNLHDLDQYRMVGKQILATFGTAGDSTCGAFTVPYPKTGVRIFVIASSGHGWDHVSVSLPNRCPNWLEMDYVKRMFFRDDETAMQLHVPPGDHIDMHPYCLHIWAPHPETGAIPMPPSFMVGI